MSEATLRWYEIGVLDPSRTIKVDRNKYAFRSQNGKVLHKIDLPDKIPLRVIFRQAKDHIRAMRMAEKIGTVKFCRKVDASYKIYAIESLELNQKPMTVEVNVVEDKFMLNASGELTPIQQNTKSMLEQKYQVEIDLTR